MKVNSRSYKTNSEKTHFVQITACVCQVNSNVFNTVMMPETITTLETDVCSGSVLFCCCFFFYRLCGVVSMASMGSYNLKSSVDLYRLRRFCFTTE